MPKLVLQFLGQFQVTLDERPISAFESDKVRALLAYLAVETDRPHSRSELAALLWLGYSEESARTNLRQALRQLRLAIADETATPPFLEITRQSLQFSPAAHYRLDVATFTTLLRESATHPHADLLHCPACVQRLQEAVALYGGDFLAGLTVQESDGFEEWRRIKQEQLHLEMMVALRQLTVIHEAQGDWVRALAYARRQLALEPWREEAHRQVIRLLALLGERSLALAHYHTCRQALKAELGIEPDAETTALYEAIRADKLDKVTRWQGDKMKETAHPVTLSSPDTVGH